MREHCKAPGCATQVHTKGGLCGRHAMAWRRHGHALQKAVRKMDLAPYERLVEDLRHRNASSPIWKQIEGQWLDLVADARDAVSKPGAHIRHVRGADREIIRISEGVEAWPVVRCALAMGWLIEDQPRLFVSDDGARCQTARRVRGLIERQAGVWVDDKGRKRKHYRDTPRATTLHLGVRLMSTFGGTGIALCLGEAQRRAARARRQATIEAELSRLT